MSAVDKLLAKQRKEKLKAEKLLKKQEKEAQKRAKKSGAGSSITGPTSFSHDGHVGWDASAGFEIRNIPQQWQKLFQAAGVTSEDMADPQTRKALFQTVRASVYGAPPPQFEEAPAAPPPPAAPPAPAAPAAPSAPSAPSAPAGGGRAPPRPSSRAGDKPAPSRPIRIGSTVQAKYYEDGQFYAAKVESVRNEGDVKMYTVTFTEYGNTEEVAEADIQRPDTASSYGGPATAGDGPAPPSRTSAAETSGGSLLDQLKSAKLRTVDENTPMPSSELSVDQTTDLVNSLANTLTARRKGLCMSVYSSADGADDDEWNDDDDDWMDF